MTHPEEPAREAETRDPDEGAEVDHPSNQDQHDASVDFRAVARVASRSQLLAIRLRSCHADCAMPAEEVPSTWSDSAFVGFRAGVTVEPAEDREFRTETSFLALYKRGVDLHADGLGVLAEDEAFDVAMEVMFELVYSLAENAEIQEGDLPQFALANSTLHAWPYWREIAQSITARMQLTPFVVGTYKMPSAHDPDD